MPRLAALAALAAVALAVAAVAPAIAITLNDVVIFERFSGADCGSGLLRFNLLPIKANQCSAEPVTNVGVSTSAGSWFPTCSESTIKQYGNQVCSGAPSSSINMTCQFNNGTDNTLVDLTWSRYRCGSATGTFVAVEHWSSTGCTGTMAGQVIYQLDTCQDIKDGNLAGKFSLQGGNQLNVSVWLTSGNCAGEASLSELIDLSSGNERTCRDFTSASTSFYILNPITALPGISSSSPTTSAPTFQPSGANGTSNTSAPATQAPTSGGADAVLSLVATVLAASVAVLATA